jgi:hypothetical protein
MSCKLYLVPEDVINTWQAEQRQQKVDNPIETAVTKVDSKMQNILYDKSLTDYDKEKLFSQELGKYISMRDVKNGGVPNIVSNSQIADTDLMTSIPKTFKHKAAALLKYIQSDKDIKWDSHGQLVIGGNVIENSHIVDLLHDALRSRKKVSRAKGWRELSTYLKSRNVPKELIGNPEWFYTPPTSPEKQLHKRRRVENDDSFDSYETASKPVAAAKSVRTSKPRKSKILGQKKIKHWISVS